MKLTKRGETTLVGIGAGAVAAAAIFAPHVVHGAANYFDALNPDIIGHQEYTVKPGDVGIDQIVTKQVIGGAEFTGDARTAVQQDPANIDVLNDGLLQPGEKLEIPVKVEP